LIVSARLSGADIHQPKLQLDKVLTRAFAIT